MYGIPDIKYQLSIAYIDNIARDTLDSDEMLVSLNFLSVCCMLLSCCQLIYVRCADVNERKILGSFRNCWNGFVFIAVEDALILPGPKYNATKIVLRDMGRLASETQ